MHGKRGSVPIEHEGALPGVRRRGGACERSDVTWISTETKDRYDHVVFATCAESGAGTEVFAKREHIVRYYGAKACCTPKLIGGTNEPGATPEGNV
jgi:hypothetical protein